MSGQQHTNKPLIQWNNADFRRWEVIMGQKAKAADAKAAATDAKLLKARELGKPKRVTLKLTQISVSQACQARTFTDRFNTIPEYTAVYKAGKSLPPIVVFRDGKRRWLADGFHRLPAAKAAKLTELPALEYVGDKGDAQWFASAANQTHGLRRSSEDKRRAIELALQCQPTLSDRAIAEHVGVDHGTVGKVRRAKEAERARSAKWAAEAKARKGRDGKTYRYEPDPVQEAKWKAEEDFRNATRGRLGPVVKELEKRAKKSPAIALAASLLACSAEETAFEAITDYGPLVAAVVKPTLEGLVKLDNAGEKRGRVDTYWVHRYTKLGEALAAELGIKLPPAKTLEDFLPKPKSEAGGENRQVDAAA